MLIAKSSKPFLHMLVDNLPDDKFEIVAARVNLRLEARKQADAERNGSDDHGAG